ncbi:hypothetical protein UCRNP2_8593 [Neofusicoccum parvum UCRNP2]|uniref:Uncharacterized protein n=1 Tax=Botryosphaeria parva (strain UCR-NP2) TaxID=1287680 RepID=R1G952_BOTPV|nr:hypothetical protein UCRNP2_8593 [Neofusicoccum parvum UCRNP2]
MTELHRLLSDAPFDLTTQEYNYFCKIINDLEESIDKLLDPDNYVVVVRLETFVQAPTNTRYWTATVWVHDGKNLMCKLLDAVPRSAKLKEDALHDLAVQVRRFCKRYEDVYDKAELIMNLTIGSTKILPLLTVEIVPRARAGTYNFSVGFFGVTAVAAPPKYEFVDCDGLVDFMSAFRHLEGRINSICG